MYATQNLQNAYQMSNEITEQSRETAPERVLRLALDLPNNDPELEKEAERIERLLENLSEPLTETGAELQDQLAYAMESLLEGIFLLLEAQTSEDFDNACGAVLRCHGLVQDLQESLEELDQVSPLVA